MLIASYNPPHDSAIAAIDDGKLILSIEGEKDSNVRFDGVHSVPLALEVLSRLPRLPDVLALGGFPVPRENNGYAGRYHGIEDSFKTIKPLKLFGSALQLFESTHERAHIFCSFGLSPLPEGQPFYALVWEGAIGRFYEVDEKFNIKGFDTVMPQPGWRYTYPLFLAQYKKNYNEQLGTPTELSDAGKQMALCAYGKLDSPEGQPGWSEEIERLLNFTFAYDQPAQSIHQLRKSFLLNVGADSQVLRDFSKLYSDALFERFHKFARANLTKKLPLVIGGGCGLNCDWNTRWKNSGLFESVFVPPCTNDSGIAIGYALDAQHHFTGKAKASWDVYAGLPFVHDIEAPPEFSREPYRPEALASFLASGDNVAAWVSGRYEIGPRALCHRSLLASPAKAGMLEKLNRIKKRESYRPIAPVCAEEDVARFFEWEGPSPYMLYFQKVRGDRLPAVTHVDGTARVQTVSAAQNPEMHTLLKAFEKESGLPVLCNTSLNLHGRGFINRMSNLAEYVKAKEIDAMVVDGVLYRKQT